MEFKLVHNPRKRVVEPDTKLEVSVECYYNRKRQYIGTGILIESKYWTNNYVSNRHPQYKVIDALLQNKLNEYKNRALDYERTGKIFDFNALNTLSRRKSKQLFSDFIKEEIKKEKNLSLNSVTKYLCNVEHIAQALPNLLVAEFTSLHIEKLDKDFRSKFSPSMIYHLHIFTQKYVKKAVKQRLLLCNPYDEVELEKIKYEGRITHLTLAEIKRLEDLEDLPYLIGVVRDRFIYSCYTGLRVSDNLALLKKNLTDTPEGYVVDLHTIKGYGHDLVHPIGLMFEGKPDAIARRWMNAHDEKTLFPKVSTSYISTVLEVLRTMAKIDKHLTFHVARHTCASLLADISQNPFLIKNILGHSDIKTSMLYIHASPESTKIQLRLLDGKWKNAR